jgi:hypothetical protein
MAECNGRCMSYSNEGTFALDVTNHVTGFEFRVKLLRGVMYANETDLGLKLD